MDFNDLDMKLKRLYSALGERYDTDVSGNINDRHIQYADGRFEHITTFGSNDPIKNQNIVMQAIHLIAALKDIIKRKLHDANLSPQSYEQLINVNRSLALITDLDNLDKHGNPLAHPPRSGTNPRITNIQQALHGRGVTKAAFTTDLSTGKTILNSVEGNVNIVVIAEIVDSNGNFLMNLETMIEESVQAIDKFVTNNHLIQAST